ncbi:MAG: MFS transporter, partial [Candidatus Bathyarchaeia archaeon]
MEGRLQDNLGILVGGFLSLFILNLLNSAYSPVLILIKEELALTYTLSGALMSSYHVGYTIGQIPWGYIADRYGCRRAMTMSLIGTASAMIL